MPNPAPSPTPRILEPPHTPDAVAAALAAAGAPLLDGALLKGALGPDGLAGAPWPPRRALFAAALAARTVFGAGVVPVVVDWAVRHGHLAEELRMAAESAFGEALANAVVHGSLGLPGLTGHGRDIGAFTAAMAERLADDACGLRPVRLTWRRVRGLLVLHVDDCGAGYDRGRLATLPDGVPASGHGWLLMTAFARRVRLSRGGRRVTLAFPHA